MIDEATRCWSKKIVNEIEVEHAVHCDLIATKQSTRHVLQIRPKLRHNLMTSTTAARARHESWSRAVSFNLKLLEFHDTVTLRIQTTPEQSSSMIDEATSCSCKKIVNKIGVHCDLIATKQSTHYVLQVRAKLRHNLMTGTTAAWPSHESWSRVSFNQKSSELHDTATLLTQITPAQSSLMIDKNDSLLM